MKKIKLLTIFAIVSVVLFAGCKKDEYQELVGVCPLVVSTIPADKAINVPLNQVVSATFNEKMNSETITDESFTLLQGETKIAGTNSYNNVTASLAPSSPLLPFKLYTGRVKTSAKDLMGNALQEDYVWTFTTIPQITLSANPETGGTTTGAGTFNQDSLITITAIPNSGFSFLNWTEDGTIISTNAVAEYAMDGNSALVANYTQQLVVATSSNPTAGGTTLGSGSFDTGASVTVTATPNTGYAFVNWTENETIVSTDPDYVFQINASRTLEANFELADAFTLNVVANNGSVLKDPELLSYSSGALVELTATPDLGYEFTSWSGDTTGIANPLTVTMNANKNITANFSPVNAGFTLNVEAINGSVLKNPELLSYSSGALVELTATPDLGYEFTSWSGDTTGIANPLSVTMNSNKNITANFTANELPPSGPLAINLGCAEPYAVLAGSTITSTGLSTINGDVGLSAGTALEGFPPGIINGVQEITTPNAADAKICLTTAYNDGQGRSLNAVSLPGQLGGLTLAPGLYSNSSTSGISGTGPNGILTLDAGGNANAVWIFQIGSTLTTDSGTSIVLAGGAQAKNIFWIVGTSATLGTTSVFYGNILADQSITLETGATLYGRALTRIAAVTLDASTITKQ